MSFSVVRTKNIAAKMKRLNTKEIIRPVANITYTQAGVLCFVGQLNAKFKVNSL